MTDKGYYFSSVIQIKGAAGLVDGSVKDPAGFGGTAPDARTVVVQPLTPSPDVLQIMGGFAGPETFLSYMRPSAEPGYNWVKPEYDAAMDVAAAEKILLDDDIFAPVPIVPTRHLVKPGVQGWAASAARYDNTQFLTLDQWRVPGASPRAPGIFMDR